MPLLTIIERSTLMDAPAFRIVLWPLLALLAVVASGCASLRSPDPLEPINRKVFAFNESVDRAVLRPTAQAYVAVVPLPVRTGVSNVFANSQDLWSAANLLLQGQGVEGSREAARFGMNSTVGILGVFDVATPYGLDRHGETFGGTLAAWGVPPGAYVVLPLLGASTARDSIGIPADALANPLTWISSVPLRNELILGSRFIDQRAQALPLTRMIDQVALDKYLYIRDAYLQRHARGHGDEDVDGSGRGGGNGDAEK
ncbi:MAG: VacJ family lipoprotein [Caldimonas sp.]